MILFKLKLGRRLGGHPRWIAAALEEQEGLGILGDEVILAELAQDLVELALGLDGTHQVPCMELGKAPSILERGGMGRRLSQTAIHRGLRQDSVPAQPRRQQAIRVRRIVPERKGVDLAR